MQSKKIEALLSRIDAKGPALGADWKAFRDDVAKLSEDYDDNGPEYQGPALSLQRLIGVYGKFLTELYRQWDELRERLRKQELIRLQEEEEARMMARTTEIQVWAGSKWGKPQRIPNEEIETPWKAGCFLEDTGADIQGRNFDNDMGPSFSVRSVVIGAEVPAGTIAGKRLVNPEHGKIRTQYCVKPRTGKKQKAYEAAVELRTLESRLQYNVDMTTDPERVQMRADIVRLKSIVESTPIGPIA